MKYVSILKLLMFGIVLIDESVHDFSFVPILSFLINNPCSYISCSYSKRENSHASIRLSP